MKAMKRRNEERIKKAATEEQRVGLEEKELPYKIMRSLRSF